MYGIRPKLQRISENIICLLLFMYVKYTDSKQTEDKKRGL